MTEATAAQQLYFFTSDGTRSAPLACRPTAYWFDNCALSLLTDEKEWRVSAAAMRFRKHLREHDYRTLVVHLGPAVLERFMFQPEMTLEDIQSRKTDLTRSLLGKHASGENLSQFQESVAFSLTRLLVLFFMVFHANDIYRTTKAATDQAAAATRVKRFADWAANNRGTGAQTLVATAVYEALASNVSARKSLGISSAVDWDKLINGAWDLMHWDCALSMRPEQQWNRALFLEPVASFVTADRRLAETFSHIEHQPAADAYLVRPRCFPADPSLVELVQRHIRDVWPRLDSPDEYASLCTEGAAQLEEIEAANGAHRVTTGLRQRCVEVGKALKGRTRFALDTEQGLSCIVSKRNTPQG